MILFRGKKYYIKLFLNFLFFIGYGNTARRTTLKESFVDGGSTGSFGYSFGRRTLSNTAY